MGCYQLLARLHTFGFLKATDALLGNWFCSMVVARLPIFWIATIYRLAIGDGVFFAILAPLDDSRFLARLTPLALLFDRGSFAHAGFLAML